MFVLCGVFPLQEDVNRKSIHTIASHAPRYSGANLSSPESAYSTGYSTDGTSPGAPPEYYINIRTGKNGHSFYIMSQLGTTWGGLR